MGFLGYTTTEKSSHIRKLFTIFVGSTKTIFNKFSQHFAGLYVTDISANY